jgi:uncharacterized protein YoxC
MSAERALFDAYREWRRLATASQKAICRHDWDFLLKCQAVVQKIQSSLAPLRRQAREEWRRANVDCVAKEKELQTVVVELKDLVASNHQLLVAARTRARAEAISRRQKLVQTALNLKRLQHSYASACSPAWTSFS